MIDDFFTDDKIIYYLCRVRAKYAKQRGKKHLLHLLSNNPEFNHHKEKRTLDEVLLKHVLPSRRKWKKLGKEYRYKNGQKINSVEYNTKCIYKTIKYYQKNLPEEPFLNELNKFILEIKTAINNPEYKIQKPIIYPKLKGKQCFTGDINVCRPISLYTLKDKILISQTNKYLTKKFDSEFYEFSHAFRAPKKGEELITHHNSIAELLKYRNRFKDVDLWVAECDMQKFYDSVGHSIIKRQFKYMVDRTGAIDERAIGLFYKFLDSYNFIEDVLPKNDDSEYWKTFKIVNGEFGWVKKELIEHKHYDNLMFEKIGVPQGGALSGLIANIVLDYADSILTKAGDDELLYLRFCDDMIVLHPNKDTCSQFVQNYNKVLLQLKLVPHKFESNLTNDSDSFWNSKSKSPYKWAMDYETEYSFPWIGFVGYEIHCNGFIRVRKSSLKKEFLKQKELVESIKKAIKTNKKARNGTVVESAINRLVGMSVGRVHMYNHKNIVADMCWVNGFKELNSNPYLKKQLKYLDKNRNHQIARLEKEVSKYEDPKFEYDDKAPNRKLVYYGKPYSYYHQVTKKKE